MNPNLTKRGFIRILSYFTALCVFLGVGALINYQAAQRYRQSSEYGYQRALSDLSDSVSNLEVALEKGVYANTAPQQQGIAAKLLKESSDAKIYLAELPLSYEELSNVNKFVSQVGDFSLYLSGKISKGQEITDQEMDSFITLGEYAKELNGSLKDLETTLMEGDIPIGEAQRAYQNLSRETQDQAVPAINSGFREMNEGFTDYPTLIYDGPFSDHITQQKPVFLEEAQAVSEETALTTAALFLNEKPQSLARGSGTEGNLPCYRFTAGDKSITISKQGGYVNAMLNSRMIGSAKLDFEGAAEKARGFLEQAGYPSMKESYYVINNNICTINYAYVQDGAVCYSDLVKVGVALDSGEIVSFSATGYLMNHHIRSVDYSPISSQEARASVSPRLTVEAESLCYVPSSGLNETLCYEFTCSAENGDRVLVYINAQTALEEQILILLQSDNGTLVM